MAGAASMRKVCLENVFEENDALQYAAVRNILLRKGKSIEITASYEPSVQYIGEWWKQLYGESEGKDKIREQRLFLKKRMSIWMD